MGALNLITQTGQVFNSAARCQPLRYRFPIRMEDTAGLQVVSQEWCTRSDPAETIVPTAIQGKRGYNKKEGKNTIPNNAGNGINEPDNCRMPMYRPNITYVATSYIPPMCTHRFGKTMIHGIRKNRGEEKQKIQKRAVF